jgi:hypothetical protein
MECSNYEYMVDSLTFGTRFGYSEYFEGIVDDVRIWNYARSGLEIIGDYDKLVTGSEHGLVGYWRMDEGEGDLVRGIGGDIHLNRNTASPVWVESTAPLIYLGDTPQD